MSVSIGVDIGGTKIAAGLVDDSGVIIQRVRRETPARSFDGVVDAIASGCADLVVYARTYDLELVEAVGMGAAGLVDETGAIVRFAPNLGWTEAPLGPRVAEATGLPTVVENDATSAAWGEFRFGAGQGATSLVAVTVGTGIGGGIINTGRPLRGSFGMAAEFGHITQVPEGRLCGCDRRGCWEQYGSGNALVREARDLAAERRSEAEMLLAMGDGTPEGVTGVHVTDAARKGDPVALEAFRRVGDALGRGMADLTAILDPDRYVIGGGVSEAGDILMKPLAEAYHAAVVAPAHRPAATIVLAQLSNDAGLIGAADLARGLVA
jgi:glucokinase